MPRVARDLPEYLSDPATILPEPISVEEMAAHIVSLHQQQGGATFSLYFGDQSGQALFAVSVFPESSAIAAGRSLNLFSVRGFIQEHRRLLLDPRNSVGTWYNIPEDETYLDVSTTLTEREDAYALAVRCNQIAFYNLAQGREIPTFGTGEYTADLPPENERLLPLDQVRRSSTYGNKYPNTQQSDGSESDK